MSASRSTYSPRSATIKDSTGQRCPVEGRSALTDPAPGSPRMWRGAAAFGRLRLLADRGSVGGASPYGKPMSTGVAGWLVAGRRRTSVAGGKPAPECRRAHLAGEPGGAGRWRGAGERTSPASAVARAGGVAPASAPRRARWREHGRRPRGARSRPARPVVLRRRGVWSGAGESVAGAPQATSTPADPHVFRPKAPRAAEPAGHKQPPRAYVPEAAGGGEVSGLMQVRRRGTATAGVSAAVHNVAKRRPRTHRAQISATQALMLPRSHRLTSFGELRPAPPPRPRATAHLQ